jgi:uroporphyrinogen decarboxylase
MIAGEGSKDQGPARLLAYRDPARLQAIIDAIIEVSVTYLRGQIDAGAEAVQLFDSWAGSLAPDQFEKWVIAPNAAIAARLKQSHPDTPVIGFPKGAGAKLPAYARETGVDAVGLDETLDPAWADATLPEGMPVQGNLDPLLVEAGGPALGARVWAITAAFANRPHVFNLGHGIGQHTPISHVEQLLAALRG